MYVQLLSTQFLDLDGKQRTYHPGDWVNVGKQVALRWVETGQARIVTPNLQPLVVDPGCGILYHSGAGPAQGGPYPMVGGLQAQEGEKGSVPFPRTLMLGPGVATPVHLLPVGFDFLDRWDMVVPLARDYITADSIGSVEDQAATKAVIRDLRVPVYDTRIIFSRGSGVATAVLATWVQDRSGDERLAFLRAVYQFKPLILAVPDIWIKNV